MKDVKKPPERTYMENKIPVANPVHLKQHLGLHRVTWGRCNAPARAMAVAGKG